VRREQKNEAPHTREIATTEQVITVQRGVGSKEESVVVYVRG
jgi:hypothetical protein